MGQMGCREMSYSEGQKRFQPPRSTMCPQSLTIISQCNPYLLCPGSPNKALLQPAPFPSSALCAHQPQIPPKSPKAGSPSLSRAATGDIKGPAIPEVTANMQSLPGPGVSGCWRKPGTWRQGEPPGAGGAQLDQRSEESWEGSSYLFKAELLMLRPQKYLLRQGWVCSAVSLEGFLGPARGGFSSPNRDYKKKKEI